MAEISSAASASVSGSDDMKVMGNMSASAGMEINEDIKMPEGLDTFESEEEQLVKPKPVKKSNNLGLVLGISVGAVVIMLAVYFLVIRKKKVAQNTV